MLCRCRSERAVIQIRAGRHNDERAPCAPLTYLAKSSAWTACSGIAAITPNPNPTSNEKGAIVNETRPGLPRGPFYRGGMNYGRRAEKSGGLCLALMVTRRLHG
jgi:hypothetical protein